VVRRLAPPVIRVPAEWSDGPDAAWYVVATEPAKEYRVRDCLDREGWSAWLPECVVVRQHKRYAGLISRLKGPLFPGYLFARLALSVARWRTLEDDDHRDVGIVRVLRLDERPRALPSAEIERLRLLVEEDGGALIIKAGRLRRTLVLGETLRVIEGPFAGFSALYRSDEAKDRINILLDILGAPRVIAVAEAWVEPA